MPLDSVAGRAFLLFQRLLPQHLSTALFRRLAHVRIVPVKNALIRAFVRAFDVELEDVDRAVPDGFEHFNAFFTRELAPGARPVDPSATAVVSPCDGTTSAAGRAERGRLLQAKGSYYGLDDLLATDLDEAAAFENGEFATFYLAPYDYHRVHSPLAAELVSASYVPGALYSVNDRTVRLLPRLFVRNERLVLRFRTATGPMIVVLVGALNVGSITTPWTGTVRPRARGVVERLPIDGAPPAVAKGELIGWFNMGSTVIVLLPPGTCEWRDDLVPGKRVRMGEAIGRLRVAVAEHPA
ncbi:MAG TPA: archaetidylserine decarboxylase [Woeseiaceae bacterium]|nr:archaetidylserine decarboxylase [Woeseiaceae bacterium]